MDLPGRAPVGTVHEAGGRCAVRFLVLERDDQRAVRHRDAPSGALERKIPLLPFDLAGQVHRFAPRQPVIGAAGHHQLWRPVRLESVAGIPPGELSGFPAMDPGGEQQQIARHFIQEDTRIADPVASLGKSAPLAHVHGRDHRAPGPSAVHGTADADIDVPLQVMGIGVSDVVRRNQGPLLRGYQPRDPVGGHPVVPGRPDFDGHAMPDSAGRHDLVSFGLDLQSERFIQPLDPGRVQPDIDQAVPHIGLLQGLAGKAFRFYPEFGLFSRRNRHDGDGHVLAGDDRDLQVSDRQHDGSQQGKDGLKEHTIIGFRARWSGTSAAAGSDRRRRSVRRQVLLRGADVSGPSPLFQPVRLLWPMPGWLPFRKGAVPGP